MKKSKNQIIVILVAVVTLIGILVVAYYAYNRFLDNYRPETTAAYDRHSEERAEKEQDKKNDAVNFTVTDSSGKEVNLSDNFGKPIVINFWATWCPYCVDELPVFNEMYKEYGDEVVFMEVDLTDGKRETLDGAKKYIEEKGYELPCYYDTELSAATAYTVQTIPVTLFIDKDGKLADKQIGALNKDTLKEKIESIM